MASLYITSAETFSGKSAICIGVGLRFRQDGYKVGYMKPVNINCPLCSGVARDEDVTFAKQVFEMPEPADMISPVALTPAKLEALLRGPEPDYEPQMMESFAKLSANRDILVMEGGRSLREGYIVNLMPKKVVEMTKSKVLLVLRYDETLMVDRALTAQWYFGPENIAGVVLNLVPRNSLERVQELVVPYLDRHSIPVMGVLRQDQVLLSPSVAELADGLKAEVLCCEEGMGELVEHMLVGAMSVEGALTYFRRKANKAVITGGDRADIQLAALETSTRCLILTGNLYPSPVVVNRAEELHVPILLVDQDTLSTISIVEDYFGRSRFQNEQKVKQFSKMLEEHFDFKKLYNAIGMTHR